MGQRIERAGLPRQDPSALEVGVVLHVDMTVVTVENMADKLIINDGPRSWIDMDGAMVA
jgi:hypothetical protein